METYGRIPTTDGWRYLMVCRTCDMKQSHATLRAAHEAAQRHATTPRHGQPHATTVQEAK